MVVHCPRARRSPPDRHGRLLQLSSGDDQLDRGQVGGPPKQPGWSKAEYEARAKESAQQHNQRYAQWEQRVPEKLDRFAVRDAVRMHLAWTYRYTLPAEEQTLLEQTQITVGDITGTPAEVSTHYAMRSEEHTSELQSRGHLVCRLL